MKNYFVRSLLAIVPILSIALAPARALAEVSVSDGFESNRSNWAFDGVGSRSGSFQVGAAHSGSYYAFLRVTNAKSWSSVGRTIAVPGFTYYAPLHCTTEFWVNVASPLAKIAIEVIDPATWTYISRKTFSGGNASYQKIVSDEWQPWGPTAFVRLVVSSYNSVYYYAAVGVDDMATRCN